jgi:alkaline phosphatase D
LQYLDASRQGYALATFTATTAIADYCYVANLDLESIATTTGKTVVEVYLIALANYQLVSYHLSSVS